jgi:Cu-processing system permease protein
MKMTGSSDLKTGLLLAVRAGSLKLGGGLLVALLIVVLVAAEFSARQVATVAMDVGLSFIRLVFAIYAVLLVQELIAREFDRRLHLTSLTYPRSRSAWLLGRLGAIGLILTGLVALAAAELALLVVYVGGSYEQATPVGLGVPYLVTLGFALVDLLVVTAIATLLAVTSVTPSFVLVGTLGFVLIARSYMPIIQLLQSADYLVDKIADPRLYKDSLTLLSFLLPDLGTLDVRMIALYNKMAFMPSQWGWLLASALAYAVALLCISIWRLNRREFS